MTDILERAAELEKRTQETDTDVGRSIDALIVSSKRNRRLINWVIVSIVFDVMLTMVVVFSVAKTNQNSIRLEQTHNILVSNCEIGNDFRNTEKSLWNYILSLPPDNEPTADQQKKIDAFKVYLDKAFAQRDCKNL